MNHQSEPDEKKLYHLFRKVGMDEDEALTAIQEIRTMAGHNIIAKMDALAVAQDAKAGAQDAKLESIRTAMKTETKSIRWVIFIVVFLATIILTLVQIYSK